jgi:peptidyl-tRNA hydrolase
MTDKILYILMRSDMDSLNPGKACAQAAHVANVFTDRSHFQITSNVDTEKEYNEWASEAGAFGTTIVLDVGDEATLHWVVEEAEKADLLAGRVHDHTYPVKDGSIVHEIYVVTCGYIFCTPAERGLIPHFRELPLYP